MPKVGGRRKKNRTHKDDESEEITGSVPKCFIIKRGKIHKPIKDLIHDMREVMYPYTALKLHEGENIKIKDYIKACGYWKMTHMQIFTSTDKNNYFKILKTPDGPTLTFKMVNYSTRQDVQDSITNQKVFSRQYSAPLLILNGFKAESTKLGSPSIKNYQIVSMMLQSMFPPLNISKSDVNQLKRVVLFSYDKNLDVIHFRHFHITVNINNMNKNVNKVFQTNKIPNLSDFEDISEFILKQAQGGYASESDNEDLPDNKITIESQAKQTKQNMKIQYKIKLDEIGPRMKLKLFKIEEGTMNGAVIYHRLVQKTNEEIINQESKIKQKMKDKQQKQEKNLKKQFKDDNQNIDITEFDD